MNFIKHFKLNLLKFIQPQLYWQSNKVYLSLHSNTSVE